MRRQLLILPIVTGAGWAYLVVSNIPHITPLSILQRAPHYAWFAWVAVLISLWAAGFERILRGWIYDLRQSQFQPHVAILTMVYAVGTSHLLFISGGEIAKISDYQTLMHSINFTLILSVFSLAVFEIGRDLINARKGPK